MAKKTEINVENKPVNNVQASATNSMKPAQSGKGNAQSVKAKIVVEEPYFVSLKRPLEVRRQILECSKKSIYSMQSYYRLAIIRQKKLKELEQLKNSVKELMYLSKRFNDKLPKYVPKVPAAVKKDIARPADVHKDVVLTPKKPSKEKTDIEKLEDSLKSIEDRLKSLK
jgi:hypothetical protein